MTITGLIRGDSVTDSGNLYIRQIAAGATNPYQFTNTSGVTSMTFLYTRSSAGNPVVVTVPVYEGLIVDMCVFGAAFPSLVEETKKGYAGAAIMDTITISYVQGTTKTVTMYAANINSHNLLLTSLGADRGFLTDYADGFFTQPRVSATFVSPLTGVPVNNRILYFTTGAGQVMKMANYPTGMAASINVGASLGTTTVMTDRQILDNAGTRIGIVRYRDRRPFCPDANRRVTLKWLNSYGLYDMVHVQEFVISPNVRSILRSGNRVDSFSVSLKIPLDETNNMAMYYLCRSMDVQGILPVDTNQWARVTIENPQSTFYTGGVLRSEISLRCTFELVIA